jgi:hypothetical protein
VFYFFILGDKEIVTNSAQQRHQKHYDDPEPEMPEPKTGSGMHSTDVNRPLPQWLRTNVESARVRLSKSEPIRYEVERLQVPKPFLYLRLFKKWINLLKA